MKKTIRSLSIVLLGALVFASAACQTTSEPAQPSTTESEPTPVPEIPTEEPINIGVVFTIAGLGGSSFNDVIFEGIKRAEQELGITYDYVEPKAIADEQIVIEEMAASGEYDLIICIAFEMRDALAAVAPQYPDQKFAFIDSNVDLPNVANYAAKEEQGSFLVGALAALAEQEQVSELFNAEKRLGFVGGVDNPIIRRFAAGFMAGARYIDPEYEILFDFVGNFNDPATAKAIATTQFNRGADLVYHAAGASGLGVFQAAEELKFLAIGVNLNQNGIAPDYIIASMLKRVDNAAYHAIKSVVDGTFQGGLVTLSLADEGVGFTTEDSNIILTDNINNQLKEIQQMIITGELVVPDTVEAVDEFVASFVN